MNDSELKAEYARVLLKQIDPFKAALQLFPEDSKRALFVATNWPNDPEVLKTKTSLLENEDEFSFLPTKAEFAKNIWDRMNRERIADDDYTKLGKLYAEVRGFIEKPEAKVQIANFAGGKPEEYED